MNKYYPKSFKKNFLISLLIFLTFFMLSLLAIYFLLKNVNQNYRVPFQPIEANLSIFRILLSNLSVLTIAFFGIFTFRISSFFILIVNGCSLGIVLGANMLTTGNFLYFMRITLIHGVTEIIGICLAAAVGLYGKKYFYVFTKREISFHIGTILLFWLVSAIIETTITPLFW